MEEDRHKRRSVPDPAFAVKFGKATDATARGPSWIDSVTDVAKIFVARRVLGALDSRSALTGAPIMGRVCGQRWSDLPARAHSRADFARVKNAVICARLDTFMGVTERHAIRYALLLLWIIV